MGWMAKNEGKVKRMKDGLKKTKNIYIQENEGQRKGSKDP